jgi:hypothetical protein
MEDPGAGLFLRAAAAGGTMVNRSITNTRCKSLRPPKDLSGLSRPEIRATAGHHADCRFAFPQMVPRAGELASPSCRQSDPARRHGRPDGGTPPTRARTLITGAGRLGQRKA